MVFYYTYLDYCFSFVDSPNKMPPSHPKKCHWFESDYRLYEFYIYGNCRNENYLPCWVKLKCI